jgi:hypothetical protein
MSSERQVGLYGDQTIHWASIPNCWRKVGMLPARSPWELSRLAGALQFST